MQSWFIIISANVTTTMRIIQVITLLLYSLRHADAFAFHKHRQSDFTVRWKYSDKTIYDGNSVDELVAMCPKGCGGSCIEFPVHGSNVSTMPCDANDIKVLRAAQELAQGWKDLMKIDPKEIIAHSIVLLIILALILILLIRGHYRIRDLWFLPSDRQWELERDPTWGLPGKVWALLQMRVVKSGDPDSQPTDRKYSSYTENPTTMGDKFWYYKQALRDMYKTHKYYKRNRYFHKLAWQFVKLGKLIPETLRRHKNSQRRAGELEEELSNASSAEIDPQENLPWEIDLADEVNLETLKTAKVLLQDEIDKEQDAGHLVNGRFQQHHQHHHHHHHSVAPILPLTKDEVDNTARQLEVDPNIDMVNVDGLMRRNPAAPKHAHVHGDHLHHHHHHHHHHHRQSQSQQQQPQKATTSLAEVAKRLTTHKI